MKCYVVWEGRAPGVYPTWEEAAEQVEGFSGAKYKGFNSIEEATEAYRSYLKQTSGSLGDVLVNASNAALSKKASKSDMDLSYLAFPEIDLDGWAVDASCMGNPGVMEYRGVELRTGREIFRVGPFSDATNNIGEFLAIVHALALMYRHNSWHTIYSDSVSGMAWVRNKKINTSLKPTKSNGKVFELMQRAIAWLSTHHYNARILKWQTERWGEIPADFGRK